MLNDKTITGNLFLRVAWLHRYQEDFDNEEEYLRKALRFYLSAYQLGKSHDTALSDHQLLYLMGAIYTRLDEYHEASKIFSQLFTDKTVPPKIKTRAVETWNEYKEFKKKKAKD